MKRFKFLFLAFLCLSVCFVGSSRAQQTDSQISTLEAVGGSVRLVPCKREERLDAVKKLFGQMGAKEDEISVERFDKDRISNVVVRKKGKSDETIIVGAHYDKTEDDGCGAIDNWTGISIIAHLFKSVRQFDTNKSYLFVAFDQEEKGLLGSEAMAKAIPKENRQKYCAMLNFDSFGFATPMSLQIASSSKLVSIARKLGEASKFKFVDVDIPGADSDSSSFKKRSIPAITLGGLDADWQNYLHSKNDRLEKINMTSVYYGYRFGLNFIAELDSIDCREIR